MSFRPWIDRRCRAGGLLTVALAVTVALRAAESAPAPGRTIEISDPSSSTPITNLSQLSALAKEDRDLEVDFLTPSALREPRGSLSGSLRMPPPAGGGVIPSRRAREALDQRRNWAFTSPEEVIRDRALRDILNLPEYGLGNDEAKGLSNVGITYDRLLRGRTGMGGAGTGFDPFNLRRPGDPRNRPTQHEDGNPAWGGIGSSEHSLKSLLNPESNVGVSPASVTPNSFLEAFGLTGDYSARETDAEQLRVREAQETQLKRFQALLDKTSDIDPLVPRSPASASWLSGSSMAAPVADPRNPFGLTPAGTVNAAPLPPSAPAPPPLPSSLSPAAFLQEAPPASLLMRRPDVTVPRRAF
jgi:hypothetical protein